MLRAALPDLREIVDLTDHHAGTTPFYGRGANLYAGPPVWARSAEIAVIDWAGSMILI